jgi:hypothetical protein
MFEFKGLHWFKSVSELSYNFDGSATAIYWAGTIAYKPKHAMLHFIPMLLTELMNK